MMLTTILTYLAGRLHITMKLISLIGFRTKRAWVVNICSFRSQGSHHNFSSINFRVPVFVCPKIIINNLILCKSLFREIIKLFFHFQWGGVWSTEHHFRPLLISNGNFSFLVINLRMGNDDNDDANGNDQNDGEERKELWMNFYGHLH